MTTLASASREHQANLLRLTAGVARSVAAILTLEDLQQRVVDLICEHLDYPFAAVLLLDESGRALVLRSAHQPVDRPILEDGAKQNLSGNSLAAQVVRLRAARITADVDAKMDPARNPALHLPEARSEMALPLVVGDEVVGALTMQSTKVNAFTPEDVAALQGVAAQLAVAVRNARVNRQNREVLRQSERRARLFHAAGQVGRQVTSILSLHELLPQMVDIICQAYGFYYAGVFLLDESGEWAVLRAGYGEAGRSMLAQEHRLKVGGHSMVGMATALGEARIALDVGEERVHFKNPILPDTRSEMALPLRVGNKMLGAVTVQSVEERAFSSDDILTLQTMADQLAVAITNAQLMRDLEAAHAEIVRTKTFEALTTATTSAIHWIGNKALPITTAAARMQADLESDKPDLASLREDLAMVAENANLIVAVKESLLGQAREQKPRPTNLLDVAQAAAHFASIPAKRLDIQCDPAAPLALSDTVQLTRALGKLYTNAMEANAKHITVEIMPADDNYVLMRVADDGPGIPSEMLEKIWAPFVTSKGAGHTGLGLTAVQHVIAQQHGQIMASSREGQGAEFEILLPVAAKADVQASVPSSAPVVLLIDDDDAWAHSARQVFADAGVSFEQQQAVEGVDLVTPGLILVDEAIDGMPLDAVLAALQKAGVAKKVLVVSAAPSVENATAILKRGVKDIVLKPYTAAELLALI